MNKNRWLAITVIILLSLIGIAFSSYADVLMLFKFPWLLIIAVSIGILLGILQSRLTRKNVIRNGQLSRHSTGSFIQHWMTVLGIFLLILSGFIMGFLFFPNFADTPRSVLFPLNLHFVGLIITLTGGFYFLTDHVLSGKLKLLVPSIKDIINGTLAKYILKRKWNREGKYLSSQKSAFLIYAILGGIQLVTGSIKVMGHFTDISSGALAINTSIHDISSLLFILMLFIHMLFVILSAEHRILLKSWFTGKVSEQYAKKNHNIWYDEIKVQSSLDKTMYSGESNEE